MRRAFDTVELNVTFYRMPPGATFRSWAARVPDGFLFAVKASRYLTHVRRLRDPRTVRRAARGAGEPSSDRTSARSCSSCRPTSSIDLDGARRDVWTRSQRDSGCAVEPRHCSLVHRGRSPTSLTGPRRGAVPRRPARPDRPRSGGPPTGPICGSTAVAATPRSCYEASELAAMGSAARNGLGRQTASGFVYFNNDGSGCALRDASVFARVLDRRGVAVASLPRVSDAVLVDPGAFVADPEGRAPGGPGRSWGRPGRLIETPGSRRDPRRRNAPASRPGTERAEKADPDRRCLAPARRRASPDRPGPGRDRSR